MLLSTLTKRGRRVYLIQDNASYHKKPEAHERFSANRKKLEVFLLGPHSPEINAIERLWHRPRMEATHNRTFNTKDELCNSLFDAFGEIQRHPEKIMGYLRPFF